jgi:hypothetical protein
MKDLLVLKHSRTIFFVGFVNFLGFGIGTVFSLPTESAWVVAIFGAFTSLGAYLITGFLLERYELSEKGLVGRTVVGIKKAIQWSDLQSVQYCPYPKAWFRLKTKSGPVVRVSFALQGLPDFAKLVLNNAPKGSIDETTCDVLRAVAAGYAPPMTLN